MSQDRVPKKGYDLINFLDQSISTPELPRTADGFAMLGDEQQRLRVAFSRGMRALVDFLVDWKRQEIEADEAERHGDSMDVEWSAPKFPEMYDTEGGLHQPISPRGMAVTIGPGKLDDGH